LERKGLISVDVEMAQFLAEALGEFPLVATNKIDKADKERADANLNAFMHRIRHGQLAAVAAYVLPVSAKTGEGLGNLKHMIHETLVTKGYRTPFKTH